MKNKGNKEMPILRQEVIDNPIPTSLFFLIKDPVYYIHILKVLSLSSNCITSSYPQTTEQLHLEIHKDVGMGLSMTSCLSIGIFLFPLFFMK